MTDLKSLARLACDTVGERLIPEEERRLTYDESPAHVQAWWDRVVRVVVEGMREPSEAQVRAVDKAGHEHWPNARKMAVGMQHALIDALLNEGS